MVPSFSTIILYSFRFPWGCFLRGLALIKRKRWGLLRWQLLLHCRSCWCLWERGLGLDRVRLHSCWSVRLLERRPRSTPSAHVFHHHSLKVAQALFRAAVEGALWGQAVGLGHPWAERWGSRRGGGEGPGLEVTGRPLRWVSRPRRQHDAVRGEGSWTEAHP